MLITKNNPKGIDSTIQWFQTSLHKHLMSLWGIENDKYMCYGRAYRNKAEDGYIAEVYTGSNEYKEVYWDDNLTAISFFGLSNIEGDDKLRDRRASDETAVHLVFFCNLQKLKPSIAHRADAEVRADVLEFCRQDLFDFNYENTELWVENVLREYPGSRKEGLINTVDMHPIHSFRINFTVQHLNQN